MLKIDNIQIPTELHEITLHNYFDFIQHRNNSFSSDYESGECIILAVQSVCSNIENVKIATKKDLSNPKLSEIFLDDGEKELSVFKIFYHICNVIERYVPKNTNQFVFQNRTYKLAFDALILFGVDDLTVNQYFATLEFEKVIREKRKDEVQDNDFYNTLIFNDVLRKLAILYRCDNKTLSTNETEREKMIRENMQTLQYAPATIALDTYFFFLNMINVYRASKIARSI